MTRILWPPGYGQQATEQIEASAVSGEALSVRGLGCRETRVGDLGVNVLVDRGPEKKRIRDGKLHVSGIPERSK